jgi:hypothetical protein
MYLCYVDESGTPEIPGNSSHFVLAGVAIPIWHWKTCETDINTIKQKYELENAEIHTGWLLRKYIEQNKIGNFEKLSYTQRITEVAKLRNIELLTLQRKNSKAYKQTKKNYRQTQSYIHLTFNQRIAFVEEIATTIGNWRFARLFAECIDKIYFNPSKNKRNQNIDEQAFEQIVSRFDQFLSITSQDAKTKFYGMLIHDNNETIAKRHTNLMKTYHQKGTFWTQIDHIIETPLFVNSELTSMIQIVDVCVYGLRRYVENNEDKIFNYIFKRADRKDTTVVGVRHFTEKKCTCNICSSHSLKNIVPNHLP